MRNLPRHRSSMIGLAAAAAALLSLGSVAPATAATGPDPTIDLLVLYTPEVLKARGSEAKVRAAVEEGIASMNDTLRRSNIAGRIRVVGVEQTSAPGSTVGRGKPAIDWLAGNTQSLRNTYDADLVSVVVAGGAGIASNPTMPFTTVSGNEAWSVVGNDWLAPDLKRGEAGVFAHELGHNLGALHDWGTTPATRGANPERHGYVNPAGLVDVMAYNNSSLCAPNSCSRRPYYSNPDVTVGGLPFGQRGGTRPSDIASVFAKTMPVVAGYRTATMVQFQYNEDGAARPSLVEPLAALNRLIAQRTLPGAYRSARIENAPSAARAGYSPAEVAAAVKAAKDSCSPTTNCELRDGTRYVTLPAKILPIMLPLLDFGAATGTIAFVRPLIDLTSPFVRVLLDPARTATGNPLGPIDVFARLSNAVGEGVRAAVTGTGDASRYLAPSTPGADTQRSTSTGSPAPVVSAAAARGPALTGAVARADSGRAGAEALTTDGAATAAAVPTPSVSAPDDAAASTPERATPGRTTPERSTPADTIARPSDSSATTGSNADSPQSPSGGTGVTSSAASSPSGTGESAGSGASPASTGSAASSASSDRASTAGS
ncbi:M12 family metallo-peptidase [Tsukamurella paurometabola]|uniref:M12 family metallo-peptidase n=1 Tax=Tsukamurella paurometabola TaxID=2061 RepID=UPI001357A0B4|nr:M12 family metallo-peptidase [Tsukamurella paurometabola]